MKMTMRRRVLVTLALASALALPGAPAMANGQGGGHHPAAYTCSGGDIPSGVYGSITVTGDCSVSTDAVIKVAGSVRVRPGASLDAQTAPSTIIIGGDVIAASGSVLGLGCQPPSLTGNSAHECAAAPDGHSVIAVKGDVTAVKATLVALNGIAVKGSVRLIGGGGPNYWSIKNNVIGHNLTVAGQTVAWIGVMFNQIGGNATLLLITVQDEHPGAPGVYVVSNTIGRNLVCVGLEPGVSGGFVPGAVNVVGGGAYGQCQSLV